jgi:3-methyladenine DNA glycosylase AlkD
MNLTQALDHLKQHSSVQYLAGMARFGIDNSQALGVKLPEIRKLAKIIKTDHALAVKLWDSGMHEARLLAGMVADPAKLTPQQMDKWANQFYSWDICDQACSNLFDRTPFVMDKIFEYSTSEQEFVKRAGFVLMAGYAVHHKKATDDVFLSFLPVIEREAWDNRNFVKKAVNWALRQIGKRNTLLRHAAIQCAERILDQDNKAAKWIAKDALRELGSSHP